MSFHHLRAALDRGGPIRVKVIFLSLVVGFFILTLLPRTIVDRYIPTAWIVVHVGMLLNNRKKKRQEEEERLRDDAAHDAMVVSDSLHQK